MQGSGRGGGKAPAAEHAQKPAPTQPAEAQANGGDRDAPSLRSKLTKQGKAPTPAARGARGGGRGGVSVP